MNNGMVLQQKQVLNLTPKMRQSIKILQMNMVELAHWFELESQNNPVLEISLNRMNRKDNDQKEDILEENVFPENTAISSVKETFLEKDASYLYLDEQKRFNKQRNIISTDQHEYYYLPVARNTNLHEHLLFFLNTTVKNDIDLKIGEYIILNINQNGYLEPSCAEIARDLGVSEKKVKNVLAIIQNSSMAGLGARNVKECLLLQLKYKKLEKKDIIRKLIIFYLNELSQKKFKKIAKDLNLSYYEIQELLDEIIKNLDPKPGRIFHQNSEAHYLVPDFIIKKVGNNYKVIENLNILPSIKINSFYKKYLSENKDNKVGKKNIFKSEKKIENQKTIDYITKKIDSASWIIRCFEQRQKTLMEIVRYIIDYQREFLEQGISYIKPLSMKKVANSLNIHESTVSRAIHGKKIQLPRGTYDLKYFFSKSLSQERDMLISNDKIKNMVKNYILLEDPCNPYSDKDLAGLLEEKENIRIARRTITKYRKLLGIFPARVRRRYKK